MSTDTNSSVRMDDVVPPNNNNYVTTTYKAPPISEKTQRELKEYAEDVVRRQQNNAGLPNGSGRSSSAPAQRKMNDQQGQKDTDTNGKLPETNGQPDDGKKKDEKSS